MDLRRLPASGPVTPSPRRPRSPSGWAGGGARSRTPASRPQTSGRVVGLSAARVSGLGRSLAERGAGRGWEGVGPPRRPRARSASVRSAARREAVPEAVGARAHLRRLRSRKQQPGLRRLGRGGPLFKTRGVDRAVPAREGGRESVARPLSVGVTQACEVGRGFQAAGAVVDLGPGRGGSTAGAGPLGVCRGGGVAGCLATPSPGGGEAGGPAVRVRDPASTQRRGGGHGRFSARSCRPGPALASELQGWERPGPGKPSCRRPGPPLLPDPTPTGASAGPGRGAAGGRVDGRQKRHRHG